MSVRSARRFWFAAYVTLVGLPLAVAWLTDPLAAPRPILIDFGVALGLVGLTVLLIQFALVSRLRPPSRPFGADVLMQWHRGMGFVALAFVLGHALALSGGRWQAWSPFGGPAGVRLGATALWVTVALIVTSIGRTRLRLDYEAWRGLHLLAACAIAVTAVWHVLTIGTYSVSRPMRWLFIGYAVLFAVLLARYRLVRPLQLVGHPWTVAANDDVGGSTRLVRVRPVDHAGIRFQSGQFAWLVTGASPMTGEQHPLSIASSAADPTTLEFAVKALGDWSSTTVPALTVGQRVWVDGAFGGFTPDLTAGRGLVLIAGGIGVAPMRSILLTLRDRADRRPVWLFYGASDWSRVVFAEEFARLAETLALRACYVFEQPDSGWTGERGFITRDVLARHLPADRTAVDCFVCGPVPMMDAVETALIGLGVPARQVHTERFQMV